MKDNREPIKLNQMTKCINGTCDPGLFTTIANWITYDLLRLEEGTQISSSVHFFFEDTIKIYILLFFMIYIIAFLRAALHTERIRNFLQGKNRTIGYLFGSIFGAITPFCSCSSIPLFLGFTSARIPLGITMSFLITSPMINEVAIILLGSILGIKFMVLYIITGITAGIIGGFFIDLIKAERYLTPIGNKAIDLKQNGKPDNSKVQKVTIHDRHIFAVSELRNIFKKVWKWILVGVGLGAILHGFVPENFISETLGKGQWWSVPAAVLLGIPLYANASGIIPVAESLLAKGLPIGTTMAFMMSVVAASFPEFIMLKQVMKPRLLIIFFLILLTFFTTAGWIFNIIY